MSVRSVITSVDDNASTLAAASRVTLRVPVLVVLLIRFVL